MIHHRIEGMQRLHVLASLLLHGAAFAVLFGSLSPALHGLQASPQQLAACAFGGLLGYSALAFRQAEPCWNPFCREMAPALWRALLQTLAIVVPVFIFASVASGGSFGTFPLVGYGAVVFATCLAANHFLPPLLSRMLFSGRHRVRMLLVGPRGRVRRMNRWLRSTAPYGIQVAGVVSDGPTAGATCGYPTLGDAESFERLLVDEQIEQVMLLGVPDDLGASERLVAATERAGIRLIIVDDSLDRVPQARSRFRHLGREFLYIREEPLESPANRILKRLLDVMVSLPVVVMILPVISLIVWILQRRQSPGPLFFGQVRSGARRATFTILKFRTMHRNEETTRQATLHDSRVFPLGAFLRRTSLDELPQFWNVLRGDMSVVGPRPHMVEHDEEFARELSSYHVRSLAKPGITGLAQVRGFRGEARTGSDIQRRVACDVEYIERWSLWLDIMIILQTAFQVVRPPRTAY